MSVATSAEVLQGVAVPPVAIGLVWEDTSLMGRAYLYGQDCNLRLSPGLSTVLKPATKPECMASTYGGQILSRCGRVALGATAGGQGAK
jgi:hypothetical protein